MIHPSGSSSDENSDDSCEDEPQTVATTAHEASLLKFADDPRVIPDNIGSNVIGQRGKLGLNILHHTVYRSPISNPQIRKLYKLPFSQISPLLDEILKHHPALLCEKDDAGQTALDQAISKKKWEHLNYFLKCEGALDLVAPSKIGKPFTNLLINLVDLRMRRLKQQCNKSSGGSSLTATSRPGNKDRFDESFWGCIDQLILGPARELMMTPDDKGNTALHIAVEYCNNDHVSPESQITLIRKLLDACPKLMESLNQAGRSPYQHRIHTRDEVIEEAKRDAKSVVAGGARTQTPRRGTQTSETGASLKRTLTASITDLEPDAGATTKQKTDQIAFLLKDHYMNHVSRDDAAKYLYGIKGKKLAMEFDLSEHSRTGYHFSPKSGKVLKNHLKFENILRYVDLPKITIERGLPEQKPGDHPGDGMGRRDLEVIFDWLRKDCGVEKIIRVKVDDSKDLPHSDESIENCLKDFGVQVWDWNKVDICCSTIFKAAPEVREVYLYCSGNNAVLRSWSADDGLRSLKELEILHVRIEQGLESLERAQKQLEDFKVRLGALTLTKPIDAEVIPWSGNKANVSKSHEQASRAHGEMWVQHIDNFVNFVVNLVEDGELSPKPVKVALIDDGVDGSHWMFGKNIKDGISFCTSSDHHQHVYNYWVPSGCHGTQMASLIQKVCPQVELYVARLQDGHKGNTRLIDPASAVKAIDWAIECEVDIISMSWTFQQTKKNEAVLEQELTDAVKRAAGKNILMFCSTGDMGQCTNGRIFPACLDDVFRIGAADASGEKRAATELDSHYLLPGEDLQTETPSYIQSAETSRVSGSSLATALASGLAALLLYCIDQNDNRKLRELARRRHRMVAAFDRMSGGAGNGPRYLKVWEHLKPEFKEMYRNDSAEGKQKLKEVMEGLFN